jgi:hypothetical protein
VSVHSVSCSCGGRVTVPQYVSRSPHHQSRAGRRFANSQGCLLTFSHASPTVRSGMGNGTCLTRRVVKDQGVDAFLPAELSYLKRRPSLTSPTHAIALDLLSQNTTTVLFTQPRSATFEQTGRTMLSTWLSLGHPSSRHHFEVLALFASRSCRYRLGGESQAHGEHTSAP